jgi:glycosyltransferase involved in cell wall biosynthesis
VIASVPPPTPVPATIVHLLVGAAIGGAERLVVDLATAPQTRFRHVIAVQTPSAELVAFLKKSGAIVEARPVRALAGIAFLGNTFFPAERRWLVDVARRHHACIMHTHTFQSHLLGARAASLAGLRHVRTEHHINHWEAATSAPFSRAALRSTDAVACISSYVHDYLEAHVPHGRTRLVTVPNGVSMERFGALPRAPLDEGHPPTFAMTCRLEAWKRVDLAIRAVAAVGKMAEFASQKPRLLVAGTGPEEARLRALVVELGAEAEVELLGHVHDTREVLARAHAVFSCSDREPFGLAVAEAMASGRPVLGVAGGGVDEVVGEDGGGVLVPHPAALVDAIAAFLQAPATWAARGEQARARVDAHFSQRQMVAGYTELWASVLGSPARRS